MHQVNGFLPAAPSRLRRVLAHEWERGFHRLSDEDLVAALKVDCGRGVRRQLEHAVRSPFERHDAPPGRQLAIYLPHAFPRVEKYGVDWKVHEHHVDPVARDDPHASSWIEALAKHQSKTTT